MRLFEVRSRVMRPAIVACLVVVLLLSGCAEQRHAIARLSPWKMTDAPAEKLPPWVKYEHKPDAYEIWTTVGLVALGVLAIAGLLYSLSVDSQPNQEHRSP